MKQHHWRLLFIFSLIFALPVLVTYLAMESGHDINEKPSIYNYLGENSSQIKSKPGIKALAREQILADDLSLTTSLFITQLIEQLQTWRDMDLDESRLAQQFEQELSEHAHIHSLAFVKQGQIETAKGTVNNEQVKALLSRNSSESILYSDPYTIEKKPFMLVALKSEPNAWLVGEINLNFVQQRVQEIGSVADANGHFFISSDSKADVEWQKEGSNQANKAKQWVPELGWQIVINGKQGQKDVDREQHGEAVVKFHQDTDIRQWLEDKPEVQLLKSDSLYHVLKHSSFSTAQFVDILRKDEHIEVADPNHRLNKQGLPVPNANWPNDEFFRPYQWNLAQINVQKGWEDAIDGAEDVIVAILDTGIDTTHQDLAEKIITGYNAYDDSNDATDNHGHGTHVAGIAAAITNNTKGIAGISWHNPLMPVKVLDQEGAGSLFEVAKGLRWATDHGAKVINLSLGDNQHSDLLYEAIRYAYDHDVVIVAAAGNDNVEEIMYPAGYKEVLAVSAVDNQRLITSFSNYGEHIDVAAPGEHIPSTFPENHYVFMSGTSMAAPHVTGLAALIRSVRPDLNNEQVMDIIRQSADDAGRKGHDILYGNGHLNVAAALELLKAEDITTPQDMQRRQPINDPFKGWLDRIWGNKEK